MKNFTFTLRDIFALAEGCLSQHRSVIRVYADRDYTSLGQFVEIMQKRQDVEQLTQVLKRTGAFARQLVVSLINEAFHDRYLTLTEWQSDELRVQAALLFHGDDIDDVMDTMRSVLDPVLREISRLLDVASDNRYSLIKYEIRGTTLHVSVGEDLRLVVFKERYGNKRWTGPRYTVNGNRIQDDLKMNYDYNTVLSDEEEPGFTFMDQLNQVLQTKVDEVILPDAPSIVFSDTESTDGATPADDGCRVHPAGDLGVDVLGIRAVGTKSTRSKLPRHRTHH